MSHEFHPSDTEARGHRYFHQIYRILNVEAWRTDIAKTALGPILGPEILVVEGKAEFRQWAINYYLQRARGARGYLSLLAFRLLDSLNETVYEVLPWISRGKPSLCFCAFSGLVPSFGPDNEFDTTKAWSDAIVRAAKAASKVTYVVDRHESLIKDMRDVVRTEMRRKSTRQTVLNVTAEQDTILLEMVRDPDLLLKYMTLTPAQIDICRLISRGMSDEQIIELIGVESKTLETLKKRLLKKLRVSNRRQLQVRIATILGEQFQRFKRAAFCYEPYYKRSMRSREA